MSLESKIESLETQVKVLTEVMRALNVTLTAALRYPEQTQPDQTQPDQTHPDQTQPDQTQPDQTQPDQTHDDLKQLCLTTVRKTPGLKADVKAILETYGATKANDVPQDKIAEAMAKINALGA